MAIYSATRCGGSHSACLSRAKEKRVAQELVNARSGGGPADLVGLWSDGGAQAPEGNAAVVAIAVAECSGVGLTRARVRRWSVVVDPEAVEVRPWRLTRQPLRRVSLGLSEPGEGKRVAQELVNARSGG